MLIRCVRMPNNKNTDAPFTCRSIFSSAWKYVFWPMANLVRTETANCLLIKIITYANSSNVPGCFIVWIYLQTQFLHLPSMSNTHSRISTRLRRSHPLVWVICYIANSVLRSNGDRAHCAVQCDFCVCPLAMLHSECVCSRYDFHEREHFAFAFAFGCTQNKCIFQIDAHERVANRTDAKSTSVPHIPYIWSIIFAATTDVSANAWTQVTAQRSQPGELAAQIRDTISTVRSEKVDGWIVNMMAQFFAFHL